MLKTKGETHRKEFNRTGRKGGREKKYGAIDQKRGRGAKQISQKTWAKSASEKKEGNLSEQGRKGLWRGQLMKAGGWTLKLEGPLFQRESTTTKGVKYGKRRGKLLKKKPRHRRK